MGKAKATAPVTKPKKTASVAGAVSKPTTISTKTKSPRTTTTIKPHYPVILPTTVKTKTKQVVRKGEQRFSDKHLAEFKAALIKLGDEIREQLKSMRNEALHRPDEENLEEDGSNNFSRTTDLSRAEELNTRLHAVEAALRAIKDGTYGICSMCGCLIPRERLLAAPFAIRCVDCKKKYEADVALDKRNQNL